MIYLSISKIIVYILFFKKRSVSKAGGILPQFILNLTLLTLIFNKIVKSNIV